MRAMSTRYFCLLEKKKGKCRCDVTYVRGKDYLWNLNRGALRDRVIRFEGGEVHVILAMIEKLESSVSIYLREWKG